VPGLRPTVGTNQYAPPPLSDQRMLNSELVRNYQPTAITEANLARIREQCSSLNTSG
jgi:hypothetical protein